MSSIVSLISKAILFNSTVFHFHVDQFSVSFTLFPSIISLSTLLQGTLELHQLKIGTIAIQQSCLSTLHQLILQCIIALCLFTLFYFLSQKASHYLLSPCYFFIACLQLFVLCCKAPILATLFVSSLFSSKLQTKPFLYVLL